MERGSTTVAEHGRVAGKTGVALAVAALLLAGAGHAQGASIALRWAPSPDEVAGYRVHVRTLDGAYDGGDDVGLPPAAADGTLAVLRDGLDDAQDHALAVSAYASDGAQSGLSREFAAYGEACRAASGVDVQRLTVRTGRRTARVAARGVLDLPADADPAARGLTLTISAASGQIVYTAHLAASEFRTSRSGSVVRWVGRSKSLRRLVLRRDGEGVRVGMRAVAAPVLAPARATRAGTPQLTWVLRVGDRCLRATGLACRTRARGRLGCR